MALLGSMAPGTDLNTKAIRAGALSLIITDLTKAVSFSTAMPSAGYRVFLQAEANVAVVLWPTGKMTTGFTVNLSAGLVGTVAWIAVEDG